MLAFAITQIRKGRENQGSLYSRPVHFCYLFLLEMSDIDRFSSVGCNII
jgi:hypothetical protein